MATITPIKPLSAETTIVTKTDLNTGPHDFIFNASRQVLYIQNDEAGVLTINLLGDGQTAVNCEGIGSIVVSAGKDTIVANGVTTAVHTQRIGGYLGATGNNVVLTVTGSTTGSSFAWITEE